MHICFAMTAEQIKSFRKSRDWSQADLASRLGVDQATVSRAENGAPLPKPAAMLLDMLAQTAADAAARESVEQSGEAA
jgi:transcriptional regulator with XRE-family HTH domain